MSSCALCLQEAELQRSHLLPKSLYRRLSDAGDGPPVLSVKHSESGKAISVQTSKQVVGWQLCAACERRLNRHGEGMVIAELSDGRGRFPLLDRVKTLQVLGGDARVGAYSLSDFSKLVTSLVYFSCSVFWRASLSGWTWMADGSRSIDLGPYQEELRLYLLGYAELSPAIGLIVVLASEGKENEMLSFPRSGRMQGVRFHQALMLGVELRLLVSRTIPTNLRRFCINHNEQRPVFLMPFWESREAAMFVQRFGNAELRGKLRDDLRK